MEIDKMRYSQGKRDGDREGGMEIDKMRYS